MNLIPNVLPLQFEVKEMTVAIPIGFDKNGVVYGQKIADTAQLVKSVDWGDNWTDLAKMPGGSPVDTINVLDDDSIIAQTRGGVIYRSDDGGATITEVFAPSAGAVPQWNGIDTYGKFVLFAPYTNSIRKIFMSNDYGKLNTWTEIFTSPEGAIGHPHNVRYDPYENIIWSCWGDHRPFETILFSDDFGKSWQGLPDKEYRRVTNIIPLPDSVLFGTDEVSWMGTYRHTRPELGTSQSRVCPDFHWAARKNSNDIAPVIWATRPAIVYGKDGIAFWSYRQDGCPILPAQVYASKGNNVVSIWCDNVIPNGTDTGSGIEAIYGPDKDGNLMAYLKRYTSGGTVTHLLKLTLNNEDAV